VRAGVDPRGIPEMFRILLNERERSPSSVSSFFATHPLEEDRIKATEAQIARINPAILTGLTKDSQGFQTFKQRVRALPAAPAATRAGR
jgi:predicted Zn-dependent protease